MIADFFIFKTHNVSDNPNLDLRKKMLISF